MKILHYLGSPSEGGVASVVFNISRYAADQGNIVDVFSRFSISELGDTVNTFDKAGIRIIPSTTSDRYSFEQLHQLMKLMPNYDIVHVHQFPQQMWGAIASFLGKSKGSPKIITTEHSTWNNRRNHNILRLFDRAMYSFYDKIVCISPSTSEELQKWLKSERLKKKIVTINNGIDIGKYANAENKLGTYIDYDEKCRYIVMAARLSHPKDPHTLIRALPLLPEDVRLIFLGDGELAESSKALARELSVTDRVYFPGYVQDAASIIKGCDIGVLSTFWDGFGLVAAEYMAAGVPAVVSDVAGLRDVVNDSELAFKPQDTEQLAQILNRLLQDQIFYRKMSEKCCERAKLFSAKDMGRKYLKIYQEIINE